MEHLLFILPNAEDYSREGPNTTYITWCLTNQVVLPYLEEGRPSRKMVALVEPWCFAIRINMETRLNGLLLPRDVM